MAQFPLIDQASLAMIAGAYKEDKVYSQLPTDGSGDFTYTRGTDNATRVNEEGNIEKGYGNLFLQSNSFNTSPWVTAAASVTSNQAGYDGFNDAWKLESTSDGNRYLQQLISFNSVLSISIYAKSGTTDFLGIQIIGGGYSFFNLSNGTLGSSSYTIDNNIELVNGTTDWYRCSFVINANITAIRIYPTNADNNFASTTGQNIYIQDAQLNQGLVAYPYLETTTVPVYGGLTADTPRLDYTDATCPSLLLEPSRTNLIPQSEYFGGWNKINQGTGSVPSVSIGGDFPLGDGKYYNLQCDLNGGTTSSDRSYISIGGLSGTQFTAAKSLWIKNNSASEVSLFAGINFSADEFTLAANADWQRITIEGGVINSEFRIGLGGGASNSDSINVSIFGAQLEAGSYPTSYIPTYGSSQTRAADNCYKTGIADLIGQTEGTLFFDIKDTTNLSAYIGIDNTSSGTRIIMYSLNDGKIHSQVRKDGNVIFTNASSVLNGRAKAAVAFNGSESVFYVNGTQVGTGNGTTYTNLSNFTFNHSNQRGAEINQSLLFKIRLSNGELAALTTL